MNKHQIAERLVKKGFTDGIDGSPEITLYEYGIIRRPSDGLTIFGFPSDDDHIDDYDKFDCTNISLEDVKEALEDTSDGFWSSIGNNKDEYINNLNNNYLSDAIFSLNQYNGYFSDSMNYEFNIDWLKNIK